MKQVTRAALIGAVAIGLLTGCGKKPDRTAEAQPPPVSQQAEPASKARETPDPGGVQRVEVTVSGTGPSVEAAVDQALRMAMQQVNGKTVDATSIQISAGLSVQAGDERLDMRSSAFADLVQSRSRGAITDFQLLSQSKDEVGDVVVNIRANVAKFERPEEASMVRVVVAPFRADGATFSIDGKAVSSDRVLNSLRRQITEYLAKSRRLAVLDREFGPELDAEIALVESGKMSTEDFARLGQRLVADYLIVGQVERYAYERHERALRTSDKTVVSRSGGAKVSFRVVNATTGQLELADSVSVDLPPTEPTTMPPAVSVDEISAKLNGEVSDRLSSAIVGKLFPITVVALDGDDVVLSQGGSSLAVNSAYTVILRGDEITDPQTGRVLGRMEKPVATVMVTRVADELSYGSVTDASVDLASVFAPGALEVGPKIALAEPKPPPPSAQTTRSSEPAPAVAPARGSSDAPSHPDVPEPEEDPNW